MEIVYHCCTFQHFYLQRWKNSQNLEEESFSEASELIQPQNSEAFEKVESVEELFSSFSEVTLDPEVSQLFLIVKPFVVQQALAWT